MSTKKSAPLDSIAPYPTRVEDVTADAMARHFATFVQLHHRMAMDHRDRDQAMKSIGMVVAYYGITYLLRELEERAGTAQADEVARELWMAWTAGDGLGLDIWDWLVEEYGINPESVNKVAEDLMAAETETAGVR